MPGLVSGGFLDRLDMLEVVPRRRQEVVMGDMGRGGDTTSHLDGLTAVRCDYGYHTARTVSDYW